ncbi:MAG: cobalt transporter CbiM [Candidatus Omnitrophica bacterium]|nr:cobalt transporter CbiM [Candidatus Omnitrophota bacterium]
MHISDGILPAPTIIAGFAATAAWIGYSARNLEADDMPRIGVMSAAFFVASLIHFKIGPTSAHLLLHGLVGIVLGSQAMLAVLMGLTLQALLLQHGGVSTIGVNACIMGIPALLVGWSYRYLGTGRPVRIRVLLAAGLTILGVILSSLFACLSLLTAGKDFQTLIWLFLGTHIPIALIEGLVTGSAVSFLLKVKPEMLICSSPEISQSPSSSASPS